MTDTSAADQKARIPHLGNAMGGAAATVIVVGIPWLIETFSGSKPPATPPGLEIGLGVLLSGVFGWFINRNRA